MIKPPNAITVIVGTRKNFKIASKDISSFDFPVVLKISDKIPKDELRMVDGRGRLFASFKIKQ